MTMCLSGHRKYPLGSREPEVRRRSLSVLRQAVEFGSDIGLRIIQLAGYDVFYEPSDETTRALFLDGLQCGVRWAGQAGVMLGLENVDVPIVESVGKLLQVVRTINSPWLRLYPDMANLLAAGYHPPGELRQAAGYLVAVHVKDGLPRIIRGVPFEQGHVPLAETFQAMADTGFWGPMTVEMWADMDATGNPLHSIIAARQLVERLTQQAWSGKGCTNQPARRHSQPYNQASRGEDMSQTNASAPPAVLILPGERYFPEGITVTLEGTFFVGSMEEGRIVRFPPGAPTAEPFIPPGANGLVSVLGLYADEARGLLWACSCDAQLGRLTGSAPPGLKGFDLETGNSRGSYDMPGGGFCNDLTIDPLGNVYVTDSWTPRILRLPAGGSQLEEWINDPQLGVEKWSLNGIDVDRRAGVIYTVNQLAGKLFRIAIQPDGSAGKVTLIETSRLLRRPDGLKVIGANTLATAEAGSGGMAIVTIQGDHAEVITVNEGLNAVATFAYHQGSAWVVENQGDHFWDAAHAGPDADPPFRIVEVPLP